MHSMVHMLVVQSAILSVLGRLCFRTAEGTLHRRKDGQVTRALALYLGDLSSDPCSATHFGCDLEQVT